MTEIFNPPREAKFIGEGNACYIERVVPEDAMTAEQFHERFVEQMSRKLEDLKDVVDSNGQAIGYITKTEEDHHAHSTT